MKLMLNIHYLEYYCKYSKLIVFHTEECYPSIESL